MENVETRKKKLLADRWKGNGCFFFFLTNVWQPDNSQTFQRSKHRLIPDADGRNDQVVQSSDGCPIKKKEITRSTFSVNNKRKKSKYLLDEISIRSAPLFKEESRGKRKKINFRQKI
jgi:hypothetical protein